MQTPTRLIRPNHPSNTLNVALTTCEGCDQEEAGPLAIFAVKLVKRGWMLTVYCPECADLAHGNFNGETLEIRRLTTYPPERVEALHRAAGDAVNMLRIIAKARDYCAEHGTYPDAPYGPDEGQGFDDWAADAADEAVAPLSDAMTHLRVPSATPDLSTAIERCAKIEDMDSQEWHDALAVIQAILGQPDGTFASMFFTGRESEWSETDDEGRGVLLASYVGRELLP